MPSASPGNGTRSVPATGPAFGKERGTPHRTVPSSVPRTRKPSDLRVTDDGLSRSTNPSYDSTWVSQSLKRVDPRRGLEPGVRLRSFAGVPSLRANKDSTGPGEWFESFDFGGAFAVHGVPQVPVLL